MYPDTPRTTLETVNKNDESRLPDCSVLNQHNYNNSNNNVIVENRYIVIE